MYNNTVLGITSGMVSRLVGWLVGWCVGLFLSFRNIEVWRKFSYSLYFPHYLLEYYRAWPKMCYNNGNIYIYSRTLGYGAGVMGPSCIFAAAELVYSFTAN